MVTKYIPLRTKKWIYHLRKAVTKARESLAALAKKVRVLRAADKTRRAIEEAEALLEKEAAVVHPLQFLDEPAGRESRILELLERQTLTPHPRLRQKLTELVNYRSTTTDEPAVLGVSDDAWTTGGKPAYIVVDATQSKEAVSKDLWFKCWADQREFPIRMTISDGEDEEFEYTFLQAHDLRHPLPAVPPGESRIYSVKTSKTWRTANDPRDLGVRIETKI
jgi:hypothetical protein